MPTPTVSHHLTALRAAGLAVSHRAGRSVLYLRTELAERLLGNHRQEAPVHPARSAPETIPGK
jgi:DNA-binding transcriptional ArsR family regulator